MKRTIIALGLFVAIGTLFAASFPAQPTNDAASIRKARADQNAAIARKDFASVANRWTEDVTIRAGLRRDIHGKPAYLAAFVADSAMTYKREPIDVVVSTQWPLAYERGKWTGRLRSASNAPLLDGEYSAQWVKTAAGWRIRSELYVALNCSGAACQWAATVP
ncbi:MAG: nuclear transport factor 2 family protein [Gemmatimonadaceae bacterium]